MNENEVADAMDRLAERNRQRNAEARVNVWTPENIVREWEAHTMRCLLVSTPMSLNGYVYVPENHPWYRVHYSECPNECGEQWCAHSPESQIEVHGGITFSHLGENGWVFGFDTAHAGDFIVTPVGIHGGHLWEEDEVATETEQMARQLAALRHDIGHDKRGVRP